MARYVAPDGTEHERQPGAQDQEAAGGQACRQRRRKRANAAGCRVKKNRGMILASWELRITPNQARLLRQQPADQPCGGFVGLVLNPLPSQKRIKVGLVDRALFDKINHLLQRARRPVAQKEGAA